MALNINPVLDINYLDQVYGDDASIIHLIFDAFLSDSLPRWHTLKTAIDNEDLTEAASIIHGLKPSFTMAGLTWLRPKVEDLERAIKSNADTSFLQESYKYLSDQLNPVLPILKTESERLAQI
ncbi:Hpt domain-containing protein [Dyadobacter psychrotolerans]|uniref:Hpt domain-containing protein n=1 Tax=Dyadobacter psychrotolerans TaxID=2541721 RepID=A0A4R5DED9_9BACT|nr:Hpt domain-containing protein [Dyadobacter psychrotolerans]TDE10221.1 Hpt domain-containing protein [Dyadobacter psychrotolerans]